MDALAFFASRCVFTTEEFGDALGLARRSRDSLLGYYRRQGRILPVRRGLYWVAQPGENPDNASFDPYLIAARMTDDTVLAYHTALEFHGRAYSGFSEFQYLTERAARSVTFRGWQFRPVRLPKALLKAGEACFGVEQYDRAGHSVDVAGLERTLVDTLDCPELCGGWEEVWRSLEMVEFFDLDQVVAYALLLDNATAIGKVGWFLECHRDNLMVEEQYLRSLQRQSPRQPRYINRRDSGPTCMISKWNLIVPEALAERRWGEVA